MRVSDWRTCARLRIPYSVYRKTLFKPGVDFPAEIGQRSVGPAVAASPLAYRYSLYEQDSFVDRCKAHRFAWVERQDELSNAPVGLVVEAGQELAYALVDRRAAIPVATLDVGRAVGHRSATT